ncbi:MAG TPA: bifunctional UDP-N-acetylglucosamine diphosphorylase/glucosamine-1-phosphate N-acetyltransferase GlmU [Solirubrobacteraceae bacterium]|nr:bifunctional UDP-N-acetylglucosamine diphosphorylase/glucosamine-1-phosphate N-acetyltransferase GlmU [Solirubrobacteraceae bacterium]
MPEPTVVILAAGEGTRMRSSLPKVLHPLCGRPLIAWPVAAARAAGAKRVIVVDNPKRRLQDHLPEGVEVAIQEEPRGTGDAVVAAASLLDPTTTVVVINGDVALLTAEAIAGLIEAHDAAGAAATMATMELDEPGAYGRVIRDSDGSVLRVAEAKAGAGDATPEELEIREVNSGVYAFDGGALIAALATLDTDNAQGEFYLPDVLPAMRKAGHSVAAHPIGDPDLTHGVDDRVDLAYAHEVAQRRILEDHMRAGVTIVDPGSTRIDATVTIGRDTTIEPYAQLKGETAIGDDTLVGAMSTLIDSRVGDGVTILHSHLDRAQVDDRATVGPFAYLRPDAHLHERAKAGTFVEIKNSEIGAGTKVPHLSYIGDADVGEGTNIGAGNITANYDGRNKHRTTIGSNVKTSVDTAFVAPVTVGDDAYTGAGSVITEDVPPGALGIARARQTNVEGYAERKQR